MAAVRCAGCNGSGRIHRGYDARRIRCPECMGRGRVSREYANRPGGPGDIGSRSSASPERPSRDIPAEISERRRAAERGTGRFLPPSVRLRRLHSALYIRVPGAGRSHSRRSSKWGWWLVALIWIVLLAVVLAGGRLRGSWSLGVLDLAPGIPGAGLMARMMGLSSLATFICWTWSPVRGRRSSPLR